MRHKGTEKKGGVLMASMPRVRGRDLSCLFHLALYGSFPSFLPGSEEGRPGVFQPCGLRPHSRIPAVVPLWASSCPGEAQVGSGPH